MEDGELEYEMPLSEESSKPKVPSPPPSPPKASHTGNGVVNSTQGQGLTKKERKKALKEAMSKGQRVTRETFKDVYGYQATPSLKLTQPDRPINAHDIQNLVAWVMGDRSESRNPQWIFVQNVPLISQVVLLFVPSISIQILQKRQELMPNLAKLKPALTVLAKDSVVRPGYTVAQMLNVQFSKEKMRYLKEAGNGLDSKGKTSPFPPSHYLLSHVMMQKLGYPLLENGVPPQDFVITKPSAAVGKENQDPKKDKLVAVDCEMCETKPNQYELTRLSCLDESGNVLLDMLVMPENPISNYHTDKSGITEQSLKGITNNLKVAQEKFLEIVDKDTILVGHALENDLKALKIVHGRCIDTAALYPHPRGFPFRSALRRIALKILKLTIQDGQHDSIVDAKTALDLTLLKIKNGPEFGLEAGRPYESLVDFLGRANRACSLVDKADTINKFLTGNADGIPCQDDQDVAEKLCKIVQKEAPAKKSGKFVWGQLRAVSEFFENRVQKHRQEMAAQQARNQLQEPSQINAAQEAANGTESGQDQGVKRPIEEDTGEGESLQPAKIRHTSESTDLASARPHPGQQDGCEVELSGKPNQNGLQQEREDGQHEEGEEDRLMIETDQNIAKIYNALPEDTLFILATGQGDTAGCRLMLEQRAKRKQGIGDPPWTEIDEQKYIKNHVEPSCRGLCIVKIKGSTAL